MSELLVDTKAYLESHHPPTYYGEAAIRKVEEVEGSMDPIQKYIITEEGFVEGNYDDTKGIKTRGVGQTGEYMNMTFKESYNSIKKRTVSTIPSFNTQPEDTQKALMSLSYRGDMKKGFKWVKHFNNGEYDKAATEVLNHKEYKELKEKGKPSGIVKRLEEAARLIRNTKP